MSGTLGHVVKPDRRGGEHDRDVSASGVVIPAVLQGTDSAATARKASKSEFDI